MFCFKLVHLFPLDFDCKDGDGLVFNDLFTVEHDGIKLFRCKILSLSDSYMADRI